MASIEHEETSVQLGLEDEVLKEAELTLQSEEVVDQALSVVDKNESLDEATAGNRAIIVLGGVLKNLTKGPLTVMATHKYAGHIIKGFPNPLIPGTIGVFAMSGRKEVEAAVVYSGKSSKHADSGWLLGFDAKDTGKVYGECGPKSKFIHIDWAVFKWNVETKGRPVFSCHDPKTGTSIIATIHGKHGKYALAAAFQG